MNIIIKQTPSLKLLSKPKIINVGEFNPAMSAKFAAEFNENLQDDCPFIFISINSDGGEVYELLKILALLKSTDKKIVTYNSGRSFSCASLLLAKGDKNYRYSSPYSAFLIHEVSGVNQGRSSEMQAGMQEADDLETLLFDLLDESANKKPGHFKRLLQKNGNADLFLSPLECKKQGLIDHIGIPQLEIIPSVEYRLSNVFKS